LNLRTATHDSSPVWVANPSPCGTFIRNNTPVYPGAQEVKTMSKPKKIKPIKPLEGYTVMSDADIVARGTAVETGTTGNSHFPTPPVDLATLKDCQPRETYCDE